MAQYEMNLRDHWLIIRRRRAVIIGCTLLSMALSFVMAMNKTPSYEATAAVKFEQSTSLSGLLVEVLSYSSGGDSIETQATLIKSYPILEEVARRLGKLPEAARGEAMRESRPFTGALDAIAAHIKTAKVPGTSIIEITAVSANPREARDLANTMADVYRDYNRSVRNARITEARKFIEAQLKEVEGRVKKSEEEVWAFRDANRIISPGAESSVLLALFTQVRGDIEKTRQQRIELEQAQARLARSDPPSLAERVFVDSNQNLSLQKLQATQVELLLERNNLALEFTDKHPRLRAIEERLREVRSEMRREVGAQVALLRNREEILNRQMGDLLQKNREVPAMELGLQRRQRDAKVNDDLLTLLKTKHQEALIKESEKIEEVSIVRPATEPGAAVGGEMFYMVFIGGFLGLLVGVGFAYLLETLDTSIGTIEDVETYLQVPVLGIVPHIDARETMQRLIERRPALAEMEAETLQSHALLITHFDPKSPVAEAYRTLRTNIQFLRMERSGKVLVITSPTLQEGKTTTIVNLALTMAQNGQRTLLVGSNLRRPSIHRFFGIDREPGLSDILVGNARWRDCIRTVADILMGRFEMEDIMASPGLDNLHIIEAGPVPANPSELLSTAAMAEFLREVRDAYDIVLIDTPPVLPVTDSAIVAGQADGVILVYQAGKVGRLVLKRAKAHLESAHAQVWGVVLNDVHTEISGYAYTQYYTHYYGEETPDDTREGHLQQAWKAARTLLSRESRPAAGLGEPGQHARGRLTQLWHTLRALLRGRTRHAPAVDSVDDEDDTTPAGRGDASGGYRHVTSGVLLLLALAGAIVALTGWQMGWFGVKASPIEILRRRLEPVAAAPLVVTTGLAGLEPAAASDERVAVAIATPSAPPPPPTLFPEVEASNPLPAASAPSPGEPPMATPHPRTPVAPARPLARFAVEFGPFPTAGEAEQMEQQLDQSGYQTVRFRQETGGGLYAVLIEDVRSLLDAQALVSTLREQGFGDAVVLGGALSVRVDDPLGLRGSVQLAERLRARGHRVRIAAQPGKAVVFVVRHGNFISREDAEEKGEILKRLGLANHVTRVK